MRFLRQVGSVYARIGRIYFSWAPSLVALALLVFLPLGLIDAVSSQLDIDNVGAIDSGLKVAALLGLIAALTTTSLLGEVFYSGAIAIYLTHPEDQPPSLREMMREISYGRLIALDIVYVLIVFLGILLGVIPGLLAFVFFGLAGPVIEIEGRTVRGSLARSFRLVRGRFWLVAAILVPVEVVGDGLGEGLEHLVHGILGESFVSVWLSEVAANMVLAPVFAIAAVLLTVDLIAHHDGAGPKLHHKPVRHVEPEPEPEAA